MKQTFFFYCDWNFTIIIICGWLLGWGLWGIGKCSSPQQAFGAAEFPVVAGRVGHDQNDRVGQELSTTLEPTKCSVYNLTAVYMWFSWDKRRTVCHTVLLHMVTVLDFIVNKASVAVVDFWEWRDRNMETGLLFEPGGLSFLPTPTLYVPHEFCWLCSPTLFWQVCVSLKLINPDI